MNSQTDAAEAHTARRSSRAIGRWPGAWLRGELRLWRSIARRRPVAWALFGVAFVTFVLLPGGWLARAWYLTRADRLHRAVYAGDVDEVRRLLAAGADVNQPSRTGMDFDDIKWTSSSHAGGGTVISSHSYVTQIQIGNMTIYETPGWPRGDTPLQIAAWYAPDTPGLIALLASAGADLDAAPGDESPLHAAISLGQAYASLELIAAGANVDAYDDQGATPLHLAVRFGKPALVRSLLEAGADPDVEDEAGRTPRSMGQSHHDPAIRALLAAAPVPTSVGDEEPADRE